MALQENRIDSEWIALNAFRELLKISTKGDLAKSTYDDALNFGAEMYPALLGKENSILRRVRESDTTKEFRQKARLKSEKHGRVVMPLELLLPEIEDHEDLIKIARSSKDRSRVDQLKGRLKTLIAARDELDPPAHSENQLIFRDAKAIADGLPEMGAGRARRDFELPDGGMLRVRVLHPDRPEQVTGADVIYERHSLANEEASIVIVQYKIWEKRSLRLTDSRMLGQIDKMRDFACASGLCTSEEVQDGYRFPHCAAFLRPTDKLQNTEQKFISSGEHLPLCQINNCTTKTDRGTPVLEYKNIRKTSLSGEAFEYLFTAEKVGSRRLGYDELAALYEKFEIASEDDNLIIHAQEY